RPGRYRPHLQYAAQAREGLARRRVALRGAARPLPAAAAGACARDHRSHRLPRLLPLRLHQRRDLHRRRRHRLAPLRDLRSAMAYATAGDGVRLYYEEAGGGTPIVFVHEFGGSYWSWEPQMGFFSRRHRCVTFAARGYAPSDIPESV